MKSLMQKVKRGYFTAQNFDSVISVKTVGEGFDFRAYLEN
jgi:hypothetical protein